MMLSPMIAARWSASLLLTTSAMSASGQDQQLEGEAPSDKSEAKDGIEFTELGIRLYGKFTFESEGDLFAVVDNESKELVPPGAVLACIRKSYAIGYYAGDVVFTEGDKEFRSPKVFFVLYPSGKVTFHLPDATGTTFGRQLPGTIDFYPKAKTGLPNAKPTRAAEQSAPTPKLESGN